MSVRVDASRTAFRPTLPPPSPVASSLGARPGEGLGRSVPQTAVQRALSQDRFEAAAPRGKLQAGPFLAAAPHASHQVYPELSHAQKGLGAQKQALWNAARAAGATKAEAAILVAQLMQEGGRDASKDNQGGAANFGPLNLNRDLLTRFGGVAEKNLQALNANTAEARLRNARAALTAMRSMGVDRYLHHVRAGATGYNHPDQRISHNPQVTNDDTRRFGRNIANAAARLLSDFEKDPASLKRDWRYAGNIPWI